MFNLPSGTWSAHCPGASWTQAVEGEIDALADADAGMADEQERVAGDIVAAQEFLLDEAILFGSQRTRKPGIGLRNVIGMEKTDQGGQFVEPSQLLHQTAQEMTCRERVLLTSGGCCEESQVSQPRMCGSRRSWSRVRTPRMMLTQIAEKVFGRGPIAAFGGVAHRSGHRPNGGEEHLGQGMHEWEADAAS